MKIKLLTPLSGADGSYTAGDTVDLVDNEAVNYMVSGQAEPVNDEGKKALAAGLKAKAKADKAEAKAKDDAVKAAETPSRKARRELAEIEKELDEANANTDAARTELDEANAKIAALEEANNAKNPAEPSNTASKTPEETR